MMGHPVILLSIFTLVAVLAIGFWQWRSVRRSQERHGETPGETTMTWHPSRETLAEAQETQPETRTPTAGDVTSFHKQDQDAADLEAGVPPPGSATPSARRPG